MSTTINGVTFNMETLRPVATHRNVPNEELGSDESFINDMGYSGLVVNLTGFETTLAKYDEVIAEFMKTGAQTLVYRSGWQLSIHSTRLVPLLDIGIVDNWFPYELIMITSTPYRDSTSETTRTKTITTNNQEWSADNSSNDIDTDGNVDAVPDIQVTGGAVGSGYNRTMGYDTDDTDAATHSQANNVYTIKKTFTYLAVENLKWNLETLGLDQKTSGALHPAYAKYTYQATSLNGGAETDVPSGEWNTLSTSYVSKTVSPNITCAANETLTIRMYLKHSQASGYTSYGTDLISNINGMKKDVCKDAQIYNTADSTVKCDVSNEVEPDLIVRINTDGTGTIDYNDDFSDTKYLDANWDMSGVTHDAVNDELDIADDGYIYWKCDAKGVVSGIPTLTSRINITAGTPTIQISIDASNWYDITIAIVDDVDTVYELDSASLSLKGETLFYWRYDCVKAAAATCSVKSFELDVEMHTIDFEHLKVSESGVSTIRCDQDAASGLNCEVSLIYRDRSWVG